MQSVGSAPASSFLQHVTVEHSLKQGLTGKQGLQSVVILVDFSSLQKKFPWMHLSLLLFSLLEETLGLGSSKCLVAGK